MKFGATVRSERGGKITKTGDMFLNIQIGNNKSEIIYILRVREDKIQLTLNGKDCEFLLYENKTDKRFKQITNLV